MAVEQRGGGHEPNLVSGLIGSRLGGDGNGAHRICSCRCRTARITGSAPYFRERLARNKCPNPSPTLSEFATLAGLAPSAVAWPVRGAFLDEGRNPLLRDVVD